ncbi:hypothetical protein [Dyella mobilis]|uniref:Uncharacterized protein n=1 Tax=Dyella mobilis TaxID=1849582 RepID=A0ABS2KEC7_9GAMM|nr:hypothetical protein [Dyella mobilis]MBM7129532.1 hypothetical protein [Dyella mobilis]
MITRTIELTFAITILAILTSTPSVASSVAPEVATVCELTRFGPAQEGAIFRVDGIYKTDFRHFAMLVDAKNDRCFIDLGVKQSDLDGSVAKFNQAVVDTAMRSAPGIGHWVDAEVVFHWVTLEQDSFHFHTKSPVGNLEFLRVFHSTPIPRSTASQ